MAYVRKTRDCWDIETNWGYGGGWEYECREYSLRDAKAQHKRYIENCGGRCGVRIVKRREPIENQKEENA